MTHTIWVTWVTFLVGQVGLIRKLDYLDVTWILIDHMFFGKRYWHLVANWVNLLDLLKALNHHWCETAYYIKLFWSIWCPKITNTQEFCAWGCSVSWRNLWYYFIYDFSMSFYIIFKKNFSMWVTRGSYMGPIQIALWVTGSSVSTSVTHFQPWLACMEGNNFNDASFDNWFCSFDFLHCVMAKDKQL